jgi:hypothetical protein
VSEKIKVGDVFKSNNPEGIPIQRKINSITNELIYYSVKLADEEFDGSYAISKKHFIDLVNRVYE